MESQLMDNAIANKKIIQLMSMENSNAQKSTCTDKGAKK